MKMAQASPALFFGKARTRRHFQSALPKSRGAERREAQR